MEKLPESIRKAKAADLVRMLREDGPEVRDLSRDVILIRLAEIVAKLEADLQERRDAEDGFVS